MAYTTPVEIQCYCNDGLFYLIVEGMPLLLLAALLLSGCGDSVQTTPVQGQKEKVYEQNATDAVGVANGQKKVSPFGKPVH